MNRLRRDRIRRRLVRVAVRTFRAGYVEEWQGGIRR